MLSLNKINITADDVTVWRMLNNFDSESRRLLTSMNSLEALKMFIGDLPTHRNLASIMLARAIEMESNCKKLYSQSAGSRRESSRLLGLTHLIGNDIRGAILMLQDYLSGKSYNIINPNFALDEIEDIVEALELVSLHDIKEEARDELEKAVAIYQTVFTQIYNASNVAQNITDLRDRLDDLKQYISQSLKDQSQVSIYTLTLFFDNVFTFYSKNTCTGLHAPCRNFDEWKTGNFYSDSTPFNFKTNNGPFLELFSSKLRYMCLKM